MLKLMCNEFNHIHSSWVQRRMLCSSSHGWGTLTFSIVNIRSAKQHDAYSWEFCIVC
jgi:hypothetical protein